MGKVKCGDLVNDKRTGEFYEIITTRRDGTCKVIFETTEGMMTKRISKRLLVLNMRPADGWSGLLKDMIADEKAAEAAFNS